MKHQDVTIALAGVAQWTEDPTMKQKVAGSIPSQGTCLGCRLGPQLGLCERQPIDLSHVDVSLPLFLPPCSLKVSKIKEKNCR